VGQQLLVVVEKLDAHLADLQAALAATRELGQAGGVSQKDTKRLRHSPPRPSPKSPRLSKWRWPSWPTLKPDA